MAYQRAPTAHVQVLDRLRQSIVEGKLRPGDQIMADEIAADMGMSRIPVREALRILEGEGQVIYEPHRGYFVAELTLPDLLELYRIRHLLETEALLQTVPKLEREDFERMTAALADLTATNDSGDIFGHVAANRRFHFAFWERLELPRLKRMLIQLYDSCDPYGSLYYNSPTNRRRSEREHRQLLKAARDGDAERLVAVLAEHREHVVKALQGIFNERSARDRDSPDADGKARPRGPGARK